MAAGGLALATMMAGVMLILLGALRMGKLLKFFPYLVVAGFTSGIAVTIFCGQLNEFLGLGLKMPGHLPQQIAALASHLHSINWQAFAIVIVAKLTFAVGGDRVLSVGRASIVNHRIFIRLVGVI